MPVTQMKAYNILPKLAFLWMICIHVDTCLFCRCLFNIDGLVADKNLKLVGVTWMRTITDIYVAFQRIFTAGGSVSQWCTGMQGYNGDPSCPTGFSTVVHPGEIIG